jgi:TonB family protein
MSLTLRFLLKPSLTFALLLPFLFFSQEDCISHGDLSNFHDKNLEEVQLILKEKEWSYLGELNANPTEFKNVTYNAIHKWNKKSKGTNYEFILFEYSTRIIAVFLIYKNKINECEEFLFNELKYAPVSSSFSTCSKTPNMLIHLESMDVSIYLHSNKHKRMVSTFYDHRITCSDPVIINSNPYKSNHIETPNQEPVVYHPEIKASFPEGDQAIKSFLVENMNYPSTAIYLGDEGRVYVEFIVNVDGSLEPAKILRGVSREIDNEARRLVREMPHWTPAKHDGEIVRSFVRMAIDFVLP